MHFKGGENKLIYPDISYQLIGLVYKIDNQIGFGFDEKTYANAFEILLNSENLPFQREYYCPITIDGLLVEKRYVDFLIDDKIIIEFKVGDHHYKEVCNQVFQYLKTCDLKLGLIVRFTKNGVKIKRIPRFY